MILDFAADGVEPTITCIARADQAYLQVIFVGLINLVAYDLWLDAEQMSKKLTVDKSAVG